LAQALAAAEHLGPQGDEVAHMAKTAFVEAAGSSYLVMAVIAGVAALIIPALAPGRDGQLLRFVRVFGEIAGRSQQERLTEVTDAVER
jgi:hypothetical protein